MSDAPVYNIDITAFTSDPYPDFAKMRARSPVCFVPQLGATLLTKHADIFTQEKNVQVFSSHQPDGLMSRLMGENMMRKDGDAHMIERKAIFPTVSPKTVRDVWKAQFKAAADHILDDIAVKGSADLVPEYALRFSAECLKIITGLTNMDFREMDRTSQGMMDGIANYSGDKQVTARCHDCTASIDRHIDAMMPVLRDSPNLSLLSVQMAAGLPEQAVRANVRLAISGGQNEPRDVISGAIWALLTHPAQRNRVESGELTWLQVFEEYTRWMSPIGMSPRRIAKDCTINGVTYNAEDRAFLMFSSANRDEDIFTDADVFDAARDTSHSIAFGAGPHFCAGAWVSRSMIADVALPLAFARLKNLRLAPKVSPSPVGWAFRGLTTLPCEWDIT